MNDPSPNEELPMTDTPSPEPPALLTRAGLERLQEEIQMLRDVQRPAMLTRLKRVTLFMDPSRTADLAVAAQSDLDAIDRLIVENEAIVARAKIIPDPPTSSVQLGSTVVLRDGDGARGTFTLVETVEADFEPGSLSIASPVGQALLGKEVGADVTVGSGEDRVSLSVVAIGKPNVPVDPTPADGDLS